MSTNEPVSRSKWGVFRKTGMLWWCNRILHVFGWAIVYEWIAGDDPETAEPSWVYPARVAFRGFSEDCETKGFEAVSNFMAENVKALWEEAHDTGE